jgi:hypothetical protein
MIQSTIGTLLVRLLIIGLFMVIHVGKIIFLSLFIGLTTTNFAVLHCRYNGKTKFMAERKSIKTAIILQLLVILCCVSSVNIC